MGANELKREEWNDLVRRKDLDNDDFSFACYLGRHNWDTHTKLAEIIMYYDTDERLIAVAFFNNRNCTYSVYGLEETW